MGGIRALHLAASIPPPAQLFTCRSRTPAPAARLKANHSPPNHSLSPFVAFLRRFYTEFLASALLSVCDQWGPIMEAVGASERVISYLDAPPAAQISAGLIPDALSSSPGSSILSGSSSSSSSRPPVPAAGGATCGGWEVEMRDVEFSYPSRPGKCRSDGTLQLACLSC
jgi:ABC-type multidrug transport system fused ATPase/permease subunit